MAVWAEMDSYAQADWAAMGLAFAQSPFARAIHDEDLLCLAVNDRMCQVLGFTAGQLVGRRIADVVHGTQYDAMEQLTRQVLRSGEAARWQPDWQAAGEAGEHAWLAVVSPLKDPCGLPPPFRSEC